MQTADKRTALPFIFVLAITFLSAWPNFMAAWPVIHHLQFDDDFASGALDAWQLPSPEDWVIDSEGPLHFLHMLRSREPLVPRRPMQFALLKAANVGSFHLQARVRREGSSLLMVFNYVDTLHFYYTHLSADPGAKVAVHNGIFIVDGAPRRRIAGTEAAPALPDKNWHTIRVQRNVDSGSIKVFVDAETQPRFEVVDHTFNCGRVGLGSFDETGDFTDVHLVSQDADCQIKSLKELP